MRLNDTGGMKSFHSFEFFGQKIAMNIFRFFTAVSVICFILVSVKAASSSAFPYFHLLFQFESYCI